MTIFIILLFVFLILFFELNKKKAFVNYISVILCFLLFYFILGNATYNNDWNAYLRIFNGTTPIPDLLYVFLIKFFKYLNYNFENLYFCNQIFIYIVITYFITRFCPSSAFYISLAVLLIAGPNISILLRYYTAFSFFLLSVYFICIKNKKILGFLFLLLSLISHAGIIIFYPFFLLLRFGKHEINIKKILIISIVIWAIPNTLLKTFEFLNFQTFVFYLIKDISSVSGGILTISTYLPWVILVIYRHKSLEKRNIEIKSDIKYNVSYKLSLYPIYFMFISLPYQITVFRVFEPIIVIWCIYLFYTIRYENSINTKFRFVLLMTITLIISSILKYIVPFYFLGFSEWVFHYLEIINSSKFEFISNLTNFKI